MYKVSLYVPVVLTFCLSLFSSCSMQHAGDEILAEVGKYRLYASDVNSVYKRGMSKADSLSSMRLFVEGWVKEKILLTRAEASLSEEDLDVENELESYRASLLIYRYENSYIEANLDSRIPESILEEYYNANRDRFCGTETVVKAKCILVDSNSPNIKRIERLYASNDFDENTELEEICRTSAEKYEDFGMNWVGMSKVALFLRKSTSAAESIFSVTNSYSTTSGDKTFFVHVYEKIRPGRQLPFEYVKNDIRSVMLNRERARLLEEFRKKELRGSYGANNVKIYLDEKN